MKFAEQTMQAISPLLRHSGQRAEHTSVQEACTRRGIGIGTSCALVLEVMHESKELNELNWGKGGGVWAVLDMRRHACEVENGSKPWSDGQAWNVQWNVVVGTLGMNVGGQWNALLGI